MSDPRATTADQPVETPTSKRRRRAWISLGACAAAVVAIIVLAIVLSNNVEYFRTVSEALSHRSSQGDARFRIAGAVVPDTVVDTAHGIRFELTDGKATAAILHTGDAPALFKPGAPVVCEGRWGKGKTFDCDTIMIRHGSDYTPPTVDVTKAGHAK
jgi:cytochrome c-type biogenesis protein CcmE